MPRFAADVERLGGLAHQAVGGVERGHPGEAGSPGARRGGPRQTRSIRPSSSRRLTEAIGLLTLGSGSGPGMTRTPL